MFGQLLPQQASAPDSATACGLAEPVTGTLRPLLSHPLMPNLEHAIKRTDFGTPRRRLPLLDVAALPELHSLSASVSCMGSGQVVPAERSRWRIRSWPTELSWILSALFAPPTRQNGIVRFSPLTRPVAPLTLKYLNSMLMDQKTSRLFRTSICFTNLIAPIPSILSAPLSWMTHLTASMPPGIRADRTVLGCQSSSWFAETEMFSSSRTPTCWMKHHYWISSRIFQNTTPSLLQARAGQPASSGVKSRTNENDPMKG